MLNLPLIAIGKTISKVSQQLNRGNGSTWPGHIALKANPHFVKDLLEQSHTKIIIVAGTNGKTTTAGLLKTGLIKNGKTVFQNESGANLLNGIASTILLNTTSSGKLLYDYAIFEVDENALPHVLRQVQPDYLILLNLFRDQLDRYGEIHTIVKKWSAAFKTLTNKTKIILNADDPQIASIPIFTKFPKSRCFYFGFTGNILVTTNMYNAADSVSCPRCGLPLVFKEVTFSHLGNWYCKECKLKRPYVTQSTFPVYPLSGIYNKYNTNAAALTLKQLGLTERQIKNAFESFTPAFGRQEKMQYKNKNVQLFLSKNPTSFNQSFTTIKELKASTLLLVLNDRIPDGRDVSWIWDTDLTGIEKFKHILIAGDRVYDMALRIKYENFKNYETFEILTEAINKGVSLTKSDETFFILPTYSAMLDVRKILTGKKIL